MQDMVQLLVGMIMHAAADQHRELHSTSLVKPQHMQSGVPSQISSLMAQHSWLGALLQGPWLIAHGSYVVRAGSSR